MTKSCDFQFVNELCDRLTLIVNKPSDNDLQSVEMKTESSVVSGGLTVVNS